MKRIVVISDLHAGHMVGLTPPQWQFPLNTGNPRRDAVAVIQRACWDFYARVLNTLQPIDTLFVLGDCVDGRGGRSGGTELVTTSLLDQADMAEEAIQRARARHTRMVYGTPYHVSPDGDDVESVIAAKVGAEITGHDWVDVNGCIFDLKHKVGGSQVPHGRHTAIARERLWNAMWAEAEGAPRASVFLRGHVHYFNHCGGASGGRHWLAITAPALQGPGSKYGVRQCSGTVDYGLMHFDVDENGGYKWQAHLMPFKAITRQPVRL